MMHEYFNWGHPFFGFPIFGFLIGLTLLVLTIYITILIIRKIKNGNYKISHLMNNNNDPINIAKKRYARGEISKEEYQEIIKNIKSIT